MIYLGIILIQICFTFNLLSKMSFSKKSSADHADIHRRFLFFTMLTLSLVFALEASFYLVDGSLKSVLVIATKCLAILAVIMGAFTVFWKLRFIPQKERCQLLTSTDSFVMFMMNKACRTSWSLTFALIMVITMTTDKESSAFPAEFYLEVIAFLMLASFSLGFFILSYGGTTEN